MRSQHLALAALCASGPLFARLGATAAFAANPQPVGTRSALASIWACGDSLKVQPGTAPQQQNTVWNGAEGKVRLFSGRQEYVSFQLVARGGAAAVPGAEVKIGDLKTADGTVLDAGNIDLFWQHYMKVTVPSQFGNTVPVPGAAAGEYPVQMVPLRAGKPGTQFTVPAGRNQPIWVDVYVPEHQTPGDYFGQAQVLVAGQVVQTVDLQLTVWRFTLPRETHLKTMLNTGPEKLRWAFNLGRDNNSPRLLALEDKFFQMAHQHRFNYNTTMDDDPETELGGRYRKYMDGSAFTQRAGQGVGQNWFSTGLYGENAAETAARAKDILSWYKREGFKAEMGCYVYDEPSDSEEFDYIRQRSQWIKNAIGDQIPIYLTCENPNRLPAGTVDIWGEAHAENIAPRQAKGEKFWAVNQGYAGGPYVDTPGFSGRSQGWMAWKLKLDGWHFWDSCYWVDNQNTYPGGKRVTYDQINNNPQAYMIDTWNDPLTFDQKSNPTQRDWIRLNGDGVMFYPGTPVGLEEPLASFTMKSVRRGLQDYEYLWLMKRSGIRSDDVVNQVTPGANEWSQDPNAWDNARLELGRRLNAAAGGETVTGPVTPTGLQATAGNARVTLQWNAAGMANLSGYHVYGAASQNGAYSKLNAQPVTSPSYVCTGLANGTTAWFKVTSVDTTGAESQPTAPVSAQPSAPASNTTIYGDALANGWSYKTGGAASNLANRTPVYAGSASISLKVNGADGYLQLSHAGLSLEGTTALTFAVHGGTAGGQVLRLRSFVNGSQAADLNLQKYATPKAGKWVQYRVPVSDLMATSGSLTGLKFYAGRPQAKAYLDQVVLVGTANNQTASR